MATLQWVRNCRGLNEEGNGFQLWCFSKVSRGWGGGLSHAVQFLQKKKNGNVKTTS